MNGRHLHLDLNPTAVLRLYGSDYVLVRSTNVLQYCSVGYGDDTKKKYDILKKQTNTTKAAAATTGTYL